MNVICDSLSKHAVARAIRAGTRREETQLLPSEDVVTFVNTITLTRDLAKAVWYEVGKEQARFYLTSHKSWMVK